MNNVIVLDSNHAAVRREIGEILSKKLDFEYYDRRLLEIAAECTDIDLDKFIAMDEKTSKSQPLFAKTEHLIPQVHLGKIANDSEEYLFYYVSQVILNLAQRQDCVIAGHAAGYILRFMSNTIRIRIECTEPGEENKQTRKYYSYYTGLEWDNCRETDIVVRYDGKNKDDLIDRLLLICNRYLHTNEKEL